MGRAGWLGLLAVVLVVVLAIWQAGPRNLAAVVAMQRLVAGNLRFGGLVGGPVLPLDGSSGALTTAALLAMDTAPAAAPTANGAQAETWLRQALAVGSPDDQQAVGIRLEQQAERWATRGEAERAGAAFALLRRLALPFPEPYFRAGEFAYGTLFDIGVPYNKAFELAIAAPSASRRDNAFRAMAHIRLCEHAWVGFGDAPTAIAECQAGLALDADPAFMTWFRPLAEQLLRDAGARQSSEE